MNTGRAYQTDFALHANLIHTFARKGFARLQAANVPIDYEDVYQDMCISFTKAQKSYNPETGFSFTAYFGRAIWNDFNKIADKAIRERVELGLCALEDMSPEDDGGDALEFVIAEVDGGEAPDELIERRQEFLARFGEVMRSVSPNTRKVIVQFMAPTEALREIHAARRAHYEWSMKLGKPTKGIPEQITLDFIVRELIADSSERTQVRQELKDVVVKMENFG